MYLREVHLSSFCKNKCANRMNACATNSKRIQRDKKNAKKA